MQRHARLVPTQTFYGKEIRGDIRETRVTQIYKILAREIRSGRWEVNSRFPSVTELTNESGLSRGSIQKVLSRLDADGLIATENRRGTFVTPQDTHPEPESSNPEPETAPTVEPTESVLEPASPARSLAPAADPIPAPITPNAPVEAEIESAFEECGPLDFSGNLFDEAEKAESETPTSTRSNNTSGRIGIALIKSNPMLQSAPQVESLTLLEALSEILPANSFKTAVAFFAPLV